MSSLPPTCCHQHVSTENWPVCQVLPHHPPLALVQFDREESHHQSIQMARLHLIAPISFGQSCLVWLYNFRFVFALRKVVVHGCHWRVKVPDQGSVWFRRVNYGWWRFHYSSLCLDQQVRTQRQCLSKRTSLLTNNKFLNPLPENYWHYIYTMSNIPSPHNIFCSTIF